ncbi:MAG TPA: ATP-binding protein [Solirubrobacterales bacterium]|nr:ATP-binding protein [Solirubrobacterales bacterium]
MPAIARSEPFRDQVCTLGICDGSGWILGPEDVARPCDCRAERLKKNRSRGVTSSLPPKFRGVSFDRPPVPDLPKQAVRRARDYVDDLERKLAAGEGIWFLGDVGTGKTTLAMLIAKAALEQRHSVAIYSTVKLLNRIRSTYSSDRADAYGEFFDELTSVDLLLLDDIGAERNTEWVIEQLYLVVNERYEAERAIVFTANSHQIEVEDKPTRVEQRQHEDRPQLVVEKEIGQRTFSRLTEMCGDPVMVPGEDHRSRAPASATVIDFAP